MDLRTGYPYWLIKNGLPCQYPKLTKNVKAEVAIIGGGISGALCAYYLTAAGISCVLVDRRTIGLGSTCASTSLVQYELDKPLCELSELLGSSKAEATYLAYEAAVDTMIGLAEKIKFKAIERVPSLFYAVKKTHASLIEKEYKARKSIGLDVKQLNEMQIKSSYGFTAPAAILSSKACSLDAYLFGHELCRQAVSKGLQIYDRTAVTKISEEKAGVKLHTEDGCIIRCKKVVNATGYESVNFIGHKLVKLVSTYALASENLEDLSSIWKDRALIWNSDDPYLYMRLTTDNRIIIGGRDEQFNDPVLRDRLIKRKSAQLVKDFKKLFPGINLIPEFSWTGTFGETKDSLPYIGSIKKHPHIYYALGFGGNGITFSLIAAQTITDLIKGRKNKNAALFAFDR